MRKSIGVLLLALTAIIGGLFVKNVSAKDSESASQTQLGRYQIIKYGDFPITQTNVMALVMLLDTATGSTRVLSPSGPNGELIWGPPIKMNK